MPALVAFGRTWEFGSDDLFFPALVSAVIRIVIFIGILGGIVYFKDAITCQDSHLLGGLTATLLCMIFIVILIEASMTVFSARGSIVHTRPRWPVVHLLHFRALLFALEIALLVIGTVFAYISQEGLSSNTDCPSLDKAVLVVHLSIAANWVVLFFLVVAILLYLDPCHCYSAKVNYNQVSRYVKQGSVDRTVVETQWRLSHSVWEKRFKVVCCIAGSDESHHLAYREIAEIFAHLFCDTNVVLSDIAAGFVLLQREQLTREALMREEGPDVEADGDDVLASFDFNHEEDQILFKRMLHFIKYALGVYTWPFYVYMNPFCGLCKLCCSLKCTENTNRYTHIHRDNGCMCHLSGLQRLTELNDLDIVYASFENSIYKVPFMVCLDHEMQSVVISFRGTLSFTDIVTDLTASTRPIPLQDYPDFLVHKGMLKTVQWVIQELEDKRCLQTAFNRASSYKLVVVGHSLGSGCACILSILLREQYPDLTCYCYSPTGALLNEAAAIFTEDFVTSITLGKDLVARMNFPNTTKLKSDLVRVLESCRKPKCQIFIEGMLETFSNCCGRSLVFDQQSRRRSVPNGEPQMETDGEQQQEDSPLMSEEGPSEDHTITSPTPVRIQRNCGKDTTPLLLPNLSSLALPVRAGDPSPQSSLSEVQQAEQRLVPLYLPGRVIHIVDTDITKPCFFGSRQVKAMWSSRYSFGSIGVSPEMFRDHLPDVLNTAMNKIWKEKMKEIEDSVVGRPFSL